MMVDCKECICYESCEALARYYDDKDFPFGNCQIFKPKSRYIELPCAVGDTVYINGCFGGVAEPHKIKFMSYRNVKGEIITLFYEADLLDGNGEPTGSDCGFWDDSFGKTVFLTKEEAEKALERR